MRIALEDKHHELIKSAILNPDDNLLPDYLKVELERTIQASKLLDKNPVQKHAVAILMQKYPDISRSQAYEDCRRAMRIFNSIHTFDYEWWHHWLLQDITDMITKAKNNNDLKAWGVGHKNLLAALGEKPESQIDPKLIEKQTINIAISVNNQIVNIDYNKLQSLPPDLRKLITDQLNEEITEDQAIEIMNS